MLFLVAQASRLPLYTGGRDVRYESFHNLWVSQRFSMGAQALSRGQPQNSGVFPAAAA